MPFPADLTDKYFPGMGPNAQHVVGATNLGVTVIDATLGANTVMTDAQLIASPPNTGPAVAVGPVVHSLGAPPSFAVAQPLQNSVGPVNYIFVTGDNSAVYFRVTTGTGASPAGIRSRVIVVR